MFNPQTSTCASTPGKEIPSRELPAWGPEVISLMRIVAQGGTRNSKASVTLHFLRRALRLNSALSQA
jgi:hypothetical protein